MLPFWWNAMTEKVYWIKSDLTIGWNLNKSIELSKSYHTILGHTKAFFSGTLISRFSGMFRDIVLAMFFGTSSLLANFMVAFRLSNFFSVNVKIVEICGMSMKALSFNEMFSLQWILFSISLSYINLAKNALFPWTGSMQSNSHYCSKIWSSDLYPLRRSTIHDSI